ncbi:zinc-binding dehydrogenase [Nocardiopsis alba]|uniref:Zinc-binding dehydrogenase family protein n=1 Tax=Nocardiopsis alba (strain ATCC BAA-2165 / BE74) TaxID=1205910 RepID=J7L6C6_NOCAA|nr:zinc-binding dehydrogenase [Nocardiopsis alba]AFR06990.1 zinc-binding dehydrogenase family protein [Nocardiopsis alba ATCC BAA-2165]
MRAVRVDGFGGPEVLALHEVPEPEPGPGEVAVQVEAANVIYLDTLIRRGLAREFFPIEPPYVPGSSVVGRVEEVGPEADPSLVGTLVLSETEKGGYAERVVVREDGLLRVPDGLSPHDALALLVDGATAMLLERSSRFLPDTRVLVLAAAGGAASLVVQLARLAGARVIGAASSAEKRELARALGAVETVDYSAPDWHDRVREITGGAGVDVVVDGAGGALGASAFSLVADGGRFVSYGTTDGEIIEIDEAEASRRRIESVGLFDIQREETLGRNDLARLALEEAREGRIRPHVGMSLPLERAAEAHRALQERRVVGKVLLVP